MTLLGLRPSGAPAVIEAGAGRVLSARDVLDRGDATVAPLGGDKQLLFIVAANDAFTVSTYAAALSRGHAVALLDARAPGEASAAIVEAYRARWVAGPRGLGERLTGTGLQVVGTNTQDDGELVEIGGVVPPAVHPATAVLLTTSGTTGSRKFVRLSGDNVAANATSIAEYLGLRPDDRPITSLPLHYSFGLSILNSHWRAGAAVVLTDDSVIQPAFWEAFRDQACTSLAGVPFTYQLLERIAFRELDLPTLQTMTVAGGALDRRLTDAYRQYMAARGGRFFVMYGQTEGTARIAYVPPDRLPEKLGSAGIAIPGGRLDIDASDGESRDGVAVGEVVYRGPNVMLGYASGPDELAAGDELGGVLRTGDLGYLDDEGFLYLVGRSKRIAKVFGHRINLDEVETRLREHGPAAVVGGRDAVWGFCGFGSDESVAELGRSLARDFKLHHTAVRLRRVGEIPTTASGKVDYRTVEGWLADVEASA